MEDVKQEESSDSLSSHTEQEMDDDKQNVFAQGKSLLKEELNKTFSNFEQEKVTPTQQMAVERPSNQFFDLSNSQEHSSSHFTPQGY